jgi:hypothetical protein
MLLLGPVVLAAGGPLVPSVLFHTVHLPPTFLPLFTPDVFPTTDKVWLVTSVLADWRRKLMKATTRCRAACSTEHSIQGGQELFRWTFS